MQNPHLVQLLQLMCIEELGTNMLCEVTLHLTHLDLCNTSNIICIDNGRGLYGVQPTCLLNVADHPPKRYTLL